MRDTVSRYLVSKNDLKVIKLFGELFLSLSLPSHETTLSIKVQFGRSLGDFVNFSVVSLDN